MTPLWNAETEKNLRFHFDTGPVGDEQLKNLPKEVRFCKRCVISNQRPRIVFDDEGVCSACRYAERKHAEINWRAREHELGELLKRFRRRSSYDVVVPCSAGKDSSMIAHRLKHEWGMTPLCVKWAPHIYTDIGRRNLEAFSNSGFDVVTGWPNGKVHRKLSRIAFEHVGDPFLPFIYGQLAFPMKMAARYGIRLVMYGENGEAEYGGDPSANDKPCWGYEDWERVYLKGNGVDKLVELGKEIGALDINEAAGDLYRLPRIEDLKEKGVEFHWFSYYRKWHPQENFYYASDHTGFTPNDERNEGTYSKYASIDDKLDGLHYWMSYVKFGIGRCTSDAAHEIRDGDIDREEGVQLVKRYDGEFPRKHLQECLDYLGLDEARVYEIARKFRPPHLWKRNRVLWGTDQPQWGLRHRVWG